MTKYTFSELINTFCNYYERKEPKTAAMEIWFDHVKSIPDESLQWIIKKLTLEKETFPKNFPGALWEMYRAWMQAFPEKIVHKTYQDCQDCDEGVIVATAMNNDKKYEYIARCARCKQCDIKAWPMLSKGEMLALGYELAPKLNPLPGKHTIEELFSLIGWDINERQKMAIPIDEVPF